MARRFTSDELHALRNRIPITELLQSLQVTCRQTSGKLRFECPKCKRFNTSIYTDHNLLRCFDCRLNFNTIEMTKHCRKTDFVKSAKWLQKYLLQIRKKTQKSQPGPKETVHIGQVLDRIIPNFTDFPEQKPDENRLDLDKRIIGLETKVEQILDVISEIKHTIRDRK